MEHRGESLHPADRWAMESIRSGLPLEARVRQATMAGHMRVDRVAARRAALVDLLADGRPHTREEIWETVARQVGEDCWGKVPREALARDLSVLRKGGIRIAFSRRPGIVGYYLQYPPLNSPSAWDEAPVNWTLIQLIRGQEVAEKNERAFAAADFALRQKMLVLAVDHSDWSPERVEREARRLVFDVSSEMVA